MWSKRVILVSMSQTVNQYGSNKDSGNQNQLELREKDEKIKA